MMRNDVKKLPSVDELRWRFSYDPDTGALTWRNTHHLACRARSGDLAGTVSERGYRSVGIRKDGKFTTYLAHRIIWKMVTGCDPVEQIDHIDMDRLNNKWDNLRQATNGQNKANGALYKNNKSGHKGILWDSSRKTWNAYISTGGKQMQLGRFRNIDDAIAIVTAERERLHGEFARNI